MVTILKVFTFFYTNFDFDVPWRVFFVYPVTTLTNYYKTAYFFFFLRFVLCKCMYINIISNNFALIIKYTSLRLMTLNSLTARKLILKCPPSLHPSNRIFISFILIFPDYFPLISYKAAVLSLYLSTPLIIFSAAQVVCNVRMFHCSKIKSSITFPLFLPLNLFFV